MTADDRTSVMYEQFNRPGMQDYDNAAGGKCRLDLKHKNGYMCPTWKKIATCVCGVSTLIALLVIVPAVVVLRMQLDHELQNFRIQMMGENENLKNKTRPDSHKGVQFSVGLTHHVIGNGHCQILKYEKIFNNITDAKHYNIDTGKFVAPVEGNYIFLYHALTRYKKEMWLELFHNSKYINTVYEHAGSWGGAGNTAILYLHQGDEVYVKLKRGDVYGDPSDIYSTFTGYLI